MRGVMASWGLVTRRMATNWRLVSILALGVLVAATLLAAAPIYARAMADLGVTYTIREELRGGPVTDVRVPGHELATADGVAVRDAIDTRVDQRVGWFALGSARVIETGHFRIGDETGTAPARGHEGLVRSMQGYERQVSLVEGELPVAAAPGEPLQVAMGEQAAALAGLEPGQQFTLVEGFDTCARIIPPPDGPPPPPCDPTATLSMTIPAVLTAIVAPLSPEDAFWAGNAGGSFDRSGPILDLGDVLPMLTSEEALLAAVGDAYPAYPADLRWIVAADPERINRDNAERARQDITALGEEMNPAGGFVLGGLANVLAQVGTSQDFQQVPLTVLLLQIAAIALFYVGIVAAIVVERQAQEISLLRARGATTRQVLGTYAVEGLILAVPITLVAPFVAAMATALLGLTPIFENVSGGDLLPVSIEPMAFALAAGGAALSVAALVAPAWLVARRGVIAERRSLARPGPSIMQRYYLDVALVLAAALLLWELDQRGSVFQPSSTGGVTSDPLLLASPAMIIAAAAAVLLRVYPYVLRVVTWAVSGLAGVTVAMGLWQLVRSPAQYTRLTLLLMMAIAVGTFAASYSGTTDRSYQDRAFFATGADLRAEAGQSLPYPGSNEEFDADLAELDGVVAASTVSRSPGRIASAGSSTGPSLQVLTLDPTVTGDLLWWRDDFSEEPLDALLSELETNEGLPGLALPEGTESLAMMVNSVVARPNVTVWARLRDAEGDYRLYDFGSLEEAVGWTRMEATITGRIGPPPAQPLTLMAIILTRPENQFNTQEDPVFVDDLVAVGAGGAETMIEDFDSGRSWQPVPSASAFQDEFAISDEQTTSAPNAARLGFRLGRTGDRSGIFLTSPAVPLPALASSGFMSSTGLQVGSRTLLDIGGVVVPIEIRGSYELFPTMSSRNGPSVVLNRDLVSAWMKTFASGSAPLDRSNEAWLTLAPGADRLALAATLAERPFGLPVLFDRAEELRLIEANPLIAASGAGILTVSFLAVLALVGVALLVSLWIAVQRRRTEFAVMRAMGLTYSQILRLLLLEYALVAGIGVLAGIYLGRLVGRQMLSFLEVTEQGLPVEPGFTLETQWLFVAISAGILLAVFVVALLVAVGVIARTSDSEALRSE